METVLLEAGCKARPCRRSHSGLQTVKALPEELVGIGPLKLPLLIVYVLTPALVALLVNNLSQHWILHRYACELTDIVGCRLVVLVRETMRVCIVC